MKSLSRRKSPRLLASVISAAMLLSFLAGCQTAETPESSETSAPTSTESISESTSAPASASSAPLTTPAPEEEPPKLLENRVRTGNGLVTNIEAVQTDGKCIPTDAEFRLTATADVPAEEIRSRLRISPETDFSVTKESDGTYLLQSAEPFSEGQLVKLAAADENGDIRDSWAFQTTEAFQVKSTYPADGAESVYVSSRIEIEFSSPVSAKTAKNYFEITPALHGRFMTHRNTLYFIPEEKMKTNTTYTVTVKPGLKSSLSGELTEERTFSFHTQTNRSGDYFYIYNRNGKFSETFLEGDPAVIEIYCSESFKKKNFDLALYRYPSAEEYDSALQSAVNGKRFFDSSLDVSGLEEVFRSSEKPIPNLSDWSPMFLMLPDDLREGYYIAEVSVGELREQYLIQVNPISVFALSLGEENLFFINDTETGKPAAGAKVELTVGEKTYRAEADRDGLANVVTDDNKFQKGIVSVEYGGSRYIDYFTTYRASDAGYDDLYYMYLYTDREAYLTSDTVNVWGLILPRRDGVALPEHLSLSFGMSSELGDVKEITVAADGTFSAQFSYTNRKETYSIGLKLLDGDRVMHKKGVQIKDYVKPTYEFDVTVPRYAIMPQRDPVTVEVNAHFYEGTPAEGLQFETNDQLFKTDRDGYGKVEIKRSDSNSWGALPWSINTLLSGVENEYTHVYRSIPSFCRDVMLETDYDKETHTLTLTTTQMDFGKIEEFLDSGERDYEILKGQPFDTEITVSVTHHYTETIETGSYYDYIEKKAIPTYSYKKHEDNVGTFTVSTVNGVGTLENSLLTSDQGYYELKFSYQDTLGQKTEDSTSVDNHNYSYYWSDSPFSHYSLTADESNKTHYYSPYSFRENKALKLKLTCNNKAVEENQGRILFAVYQNDFLTQTVYDTVSFDYFPSLSCLPNARFSGAYFDGRHVFSIYGGNMRFDPEERNITLEVTPDRETYDAGDTVRLSVRALDENGRPVSGAAVSLSVVDEAAFAVAPQEVDILDDLYAYIWEYPYTSSYCSYIQHVMGSDSQGEMGGGGPDGENRDYFTDTPYFGAAVTDANGRAEIVFDLADNLTTWRATVQAVKELETGRLLAGDAICPIVATRPVFITPIMLSTYLEGDDIAVTAKCHGIGADDMITAQITGNGVDMTLSALSAQTFNFGKLPVGEYKVLFTAEKDGNRDAIELPLTVVDTILEVDITRDFDLADGMDITPVKWPVTIAFFDREYMFYTEILQNLTRHMDERIDMQIAQRFAEKELGYITEEEFVNEFSHVTSEGLASLLPASEGSAELTALICAAAPELVTRSAVVSKFEAILSSQSSDKIDRSCAYMGLAALGEPILEEVKTVLESGEFTDYYDKMRLAAALALCGDYNAAYESYVQFTPEVLVWDGDPKNIQAWISSPLDETQEYTKLALITASVLNLPEAENFARYLASGSPIYDSYSLELMIYLKNYTPEVEGRAEFTYTLNGETETVTLDRFRGKLIRFGEEQFKNADFKVVSGSVYALTQYVGRVSEQSDPATLSVTKTMSGDFTVGGEITVTIRTRMFSVVDDVLPSCGRYIDKQDRCYHRSGQRVSLYTNENGIATYRFRITTEGEYVVESAVAQDWNDEWGESKRDRITVRKSIETA